MLKKVPGTTAAFLATVGSDRSDRYESGKTHSYNREEFDHILNTARHDVRLAAARIRGNRALLARWRAGEIDRQDQQQWRRGQVLDMVDREADVPRYADGRLPLNWVFRLGTVAEHLAALHLTAPDAAAFLTLLVGLTGQNRGTIVTAPAAHHRPDGYAGPLATAIVELDKPRRGPHRHMDVAFVDLPDWVPAPEQTPEQSEDLDLRTPFGVYMLLHELTTASRRILGTDRLLAWAAPRASHLPDQIVRTGLLSDHVTRWATQRGLVFAVPVEKLSEEEPDKESGHGDEASEPATSPLNLTRLRLTHAELHQRPVAHSQPTLANEYLLRNRGNISEYQKVVADVLAKEVVKARTRAALRTLSADEVEQARTDPKPIAARHGLDAATLRRMLAGEMDTVMTACADPKSSPHSREGQLCQTSFMLCLSCSRRARSVFAAPCRSRRGRRSPDGSC